VRLQGKIALVSGAGGPMGRAVARRFAEEGAALAITDISGGRLQETVDLLGDDGIESGRIVALRADVTAKAEALALAEQALTRFGRVDILANIVGGVRDTALYQSVLTMSEERWDATFALNLKGGLHLVQQLAPGMIEGGSGKILNVSSINYAGEAGNADYGAAKAAVASFTRTLAIEFAPTVNVNCIVPGAIETRAMEKLGVEEKEGYRTRNLLKRLGRPRDIANAALFLCSDEASFITGHLLPVAGGVSPAL
jgi:NAD(P)-dependent dehydrogenase (short-subunit alcohol dehydrogenase family)